jgi:enediyne biosynthesis protein E4
MHRRPPLSPKRSIAFLSIIGAAMLCQPLLADGGVTFTNIAAGGGAGIGYERFGTPAREADLDAFYTVGFPAPFNSFILAETPQKPHGAPGVALLDYDNDGDLDIYVTNGPGHANSLFSNQLVPTGTLTFVDVAAAAQVEAIAQDSSGVCFGDIDNDGHEDIYVTGIGEPNVLFRSKGDGSFEDITAAAGAGAGNFHHSGCALADFDGDGRLDIAIGNTYSDWLNRRVVFLPIYDSVEPNQLLLQRSNGGAIQFEDVSDTSGIRSLGPYANLNGASYTWAIAAVDYDQDGDADLMWADTGPSSGTNITQDRGWVRVLQNDGHANFTDVTQAIGMAVQGGWMGLSYGDFNCDNALDIFATNLGAYVGFPNTQSHWFLGDGAGNFIDPGLGPNIHGTPFGWGTSVLDYDNDGDQDVFFYGDDDLLTLIPMENKGTVLQNHGCNANFSYDTGALLHDHRFREVNGVATGDLNNDGWQDVATVAIFRIVPVPGRTLPITAASPPQDPVIDASGLIEVVMRFSMGRFVFIPHTFPRGDLALEVNSGGNGNRSLRVKTLGTVGLTNGGKANRDGIGALVKFTPEGGRTVLSPVMGGGSHASQDSRIMNFGLGTATKGTVEITWPGGVKNILFDVRADELINFPEIPCDYRTSSWKNFGLFNACVTTALDQLRNTGQITQADRERFRDSARRVFGQ